MDPHDIGDALVQTLYSKLDDATIEEMLEYGRTAPADAKECQMLNRALERELRRRKEEKK